jgi:hypothetical protein
VGAAVSDDDGGKSHKTSVDYSLGHPDGDHCGVCAHLSIGPRPGLHTCSRVQGLIETRMWCRLFKGRK